MRTDEQRVKLKEGEKKNKHLDLARELKKTVLAIVIYALGKICKRQVQEIGGLRNKKTSGDHPNYNCTLAIIWLCVKRTSNLHKDRT